VSQIDNVALQAGCEFYFLVTLTPAATAGASTVEQTFTLSSAAPKLQPSDTIYVQDNAGPTNSVTMVHARANSSGQLIIAYNNPTAGSLTYPAHQIVVSVIRLPVGTIAV
jgi:hypothetical protein